MVCGVSVGSRQTRKERRARRRRAQLRKLPSTALRESAYTGRNLLKESASTVLSGLITVTYALGKGIKKSAGVALRESLHTGRNLLIAMVHASIRGAARDSLLFVALLGSSAAAVASVFADKIELATLFCLLALILCTALWARGAS